MAGTHFIKQNDTLPVIQETLLLGGAAINLTGATVKFHLKSPAGVVKVNANATIVDAVNGVVKYVWQIGDTDTVGEFQREWEITFSAGNILTIPNDQVGYPVNIQDDIA